MTEIALRVEGLSKMYQLGEIGTGTLSKDIERWWFRVRKKEDPFLKIGEINDRSSKSSSEVVWSLKDINFEIQQGESVGIIGRNGAGKSTLLKILSRITSPTLGKALIKGRVASLLEVGTGFHPELTGRENIYLNGAILGMRKSEIGKNFDAIVEFAGIERYVDTPVKRYSSGMYVRLAFAVAAFLDSDILIVDEVLAVGDAEFQRKCLGKMKEVSRGQGRTILFVSHNMGSILNFCQKGILLDKGRILDMSDIQSVVKRYTNLTQSSTNDESLQNQIKSFNDKRKLITIESISIVGSNQSIYFLNTSDSVKIRIKYNVTSEVRGLRIGFDVFYKGEIDYHIFRTFHDENETTAQGVTFSGNYESSITVNGDLFKSGEYKFVFIAGIYNSHMITTDEISFLLTFENIDGVNNNYKDLRPGVIMPRNDWKTIKK
ncbi:MAG: ATP-binding cassette domain-containing protein [Chitinophagaceae bacterium]|nr:ATP-binding cassette domain-containing protein [Chitinophagaceae bacterium]